MPQQGQQRIPVRLHETETRYVLAAPVPGLSIPNATDGHRGAVASFRLEAVDPTRSVRLGRPAGGPPSD